MIENLHSENKEIYDKLIQELKGEIEFLRKIVGPKGT